MWNICCSSRKPSSGLKIQLACRDSFVAGSGEVPRPSVEPLRPQRNAPPQPLPRGSEPWLLVNSTSDEETVPPRAASFLVISFADRPAECLVLLACTCSSFRAPFAACNGVNQQVAASVLSTCYESWLVSDLSSEDH